MEDEVVEVPSSRSYFYVGGEYADNGSSEHIFQGQMYVERLSPVISGPQKETPLVFIHGNAQTGTNWLNTPDNRPGWASYFLEKGYTCYILDQTRRGRSPAHPHAGNLIVYPAELIQKRFTAVKKYMLYPQAALHTQWPGEGVMGDPAFDAYFASTVPAEGSPSRQQKAIQAAGAALLDRIGKPVILVTHSQGGLAGWVITDARPHLVDAHVALEPTGPPFQNRVFSDPPAPARKWGLTDIPIAYSPSVGNPTTDLKRTTIRLEDPTIPGRTGPGDALAVPCIIQAGGGGEGEGGGKGGSGGGSEEEGSGQENPPRKLVNLAKTKVLVVTAEASYHAMYDYGLVAFLRQGGVDTDWAELGGPKLGIHGNGHMMFMERNSREIAHVVWKWIEAV